MDKQTKIEEKRKHFVEVNEMAKDIELAGKCTSFNNGKIDLTLFKTSEEIAETLYNLNYRKIPEGAVVLTDEKAVRAHKIREMLDNLGVLAILEYERNEARKETAEKFAEMAKAKARWMRDHHGDYTAVDIYDIDEIAKEITEGKV